jgi:hypothetical protein
MMAAYRDPDRALGKQAVQAVIDFFAAGVLDGLEELGRLGRTMRQRAADTLALFDLPGTSSGPTEAINGRLEHLRGSALGRSMTTVTYSSQRRVWRHMLVDTLERPSRQHSEAAAARTAHAGRLARSTSQLWDAHPSGVSQAEDVGGRGDHQGVAVATSVRALPDGPRTETLP